MTSDQCVVQLMIRHWLKKTQYNTKVIRYKKSWLTTPISYDNTTTKSPQDQMEIVNLIIVAQKLLISRIWCQLTKWISQVCQSVLLCHSDNPHCHWLPYHMIIDWVVLIWQSQFRNTHVLTTSLATQMK